MNKHGFIYIWFDRKHKRYYIGCRWGHENDGYICSSFWLKNAFKRRPEDFKRRILETNIPERSILLEREYYWLNQIKQHELGKRYYNLHNHKFNHWTTNPKSRAEIRKIISEKHKGKSFSPKTQFKPGECRSPDTQFKKGQRAHNKGVPHSEQQIRKMSDAKRGKPSNSPTKFKSGQNTGAGNTNAKSIRTPYGIFDTMIEASRQLNIPYMTVGNRVRSASNTEWTYN